MIVTGWRRLRGAWVRAGLLALVLVLPAAAAAQTYPRDITGVPAPPCVFFGSDGTPTLCSSTDPLPMTARTTSSTDPSGFGKAFFAATPSPAIARQSVVVFDGQLPSASLIKVNAGGNALEIYKSNTSGRTYSLALTVGGTDLPSNVLNQVEALTRTALGTYLLGIQVAAAPQLWRSTTLSQWTAATLTGAAGFAFPTGFAQQGSTILATLVDGAITDATICRSTNDGVTYACANPAALGVISNNGLASPAVNVWLAIDTTNVNRVIARSTNDGVAWTAVASVADGGGTTQSIQCLTATICLATAGKRIHRSTDAGLTWTQVYAADSQLFIYRALFNFGAGVVVALGEDNGGVNLHPLRTIDFGVTWTPQPLSTGATVSAAGAVLSQYTRDVLGGVAILTKVDPQTPSVTVEVLYSPIIIGQFIQAPNGNTLGIDANGNITGNQGLAALQANRWPFFWSDGVAERGTGINAVSFVPVQGLTILNVAPVVSAANTAAVVTLPGAAGQRVCVRTIAVKATGAAATFTLTASDGATLIFDVGVQTAALNGAADLFQGTPLFCGNTGNSVTINIGAGGAGAVTTTSTIADRG